MYHRVREEVFDGILTAALEEFIDEVDKSLPSDEELAAMYPISKKARRRYKRIAKARKYGTALPLVYLRRAAIVFLAVVSLSFGILVTNSDVRAAVTDAVVTWYEGYIKIDFGKSPVVDDTEIVDFESLNIGYIPEGFELGSSNVDIGCKEYMYFADNGDYLMIGLYSLDSVGVGILTDIENTDYEETTINGNTAYILYTPTERAGTIVIGNSQYTISVTAILEKSEIIKVAENIK